MVYGRIVQRGNLMCTYGGNGRCPTADDAFSPMQRSVPGFTTTPLVDAGSALTHLPNTLPGLGAPAKLTLSPSMRTSVASSMKSPSTGAATAWTGSEVGQST